MKWASKLKDRNYQTCTKEKKTYLKCTIPIELNKEFYEENKIIE